MIDWGGCRSRPRCRPFWGFAFGGRHKQLMLCCETKDARVVHCVTSAWSLTLIALRSDRFLLEMGLYVPCISSGIHRLETVRKVLNVTSNIWNLRNYNIACISLLLASAREACTSPMNIARWPSISPLLQCLIDMRHQVSIDGTSLDTFTASSHNASYEF